MHKFIHGCFENSLTRSLRICITCKQSCQNRLDYTPPLPVDTKFAVKEDVLPDGTHIPKGSIVAYASYAMGRMEQLWGSDCLEFKQERWLQNGVFVPQCPYKYAVFQAGPRICLGKELALLQIKLVTARLINCFDFDVPEDFKPTYEISFLLPMKYGPPTKISPSERES